MRKLLSKFTILFALLSVVVPVMAQGPITPQHSDPVWQAAYWNNMSLSGTPVLLREEANIDHNWGSGSPDSSVNADGFSARWTRYIDVTPGTYVFTVTSDDGIRLWVDGDLIIDRWYDHAPQTFSAEKELSSGHHLVKVEYYENGGQAVAKLEWQLKGTPPEITHWRGEYFNNITLSGDPVLVRNDTSIDFNWGNSSPVPGVVPEDRFSVRWTRTLDLSAASYHFTLTTDDGARLWVNGHLLIDAWQDQAPQTYTEDIFLPGGPVTIELQYYENQGGAVARLSWNTDAPPTPPPSPGTVIVDDLDSGFVQGGAASGWRTANEGHNGHLLWTLNNDVVRSNYNWARWYPALRAGRYEVYVYVPDRYTTTGQARYWILHEDGYTLKIVNQSAHGGTWVSLGTYNFSGSGTEYVSLADVTFEAYHSRLIAFDAIKWEPR